jgi:hypothetical protein
MHLFEIVTAFGITLNVFAGDYDEAAVLYMAWHTVNRSEDMPDFEVKRRNPRWPGVNAKHVEAALARNTVGIGYYHRKEGWLILSPVDRHDG